jgi:hypothetical protein
VFDSAAIRQAAKFYETTCRNLGWQVQLFSKRQDANALKISKQAKMARTNYEPALQSKEQVSETLSLTGRKI